MDIDGVFSEIGELGPFQLKLVAVFCTLSVWSASFMVHMVFVGATPPFTCLNQSQLSCPSDGQICNNVTFSGNFSSIVSEVYSALAALHTWAACHMLHVVYVGATPKFTCLHGNKEMTAGCPTDGRSCSSPDFSKGEFSSIVSEWSLVCAEGYKSSLVQSIFMAGVLLGAFIFGNLSDKNGRRKSLFISIGGLTLFGFLSSFATGYIMYCTLRFSAGILCGGMILVSFVLATEVVGGSKRALCGMIIPAVFALGIALFAFTAYIITSWRLLSVLTSLPGLLALLYFWFVPESPRWLLSQGRVADAEKVLVDIANRNLGAQYPKVIRLKAISTQTDAKTSYGLMDILGRPGLRLLSAIQIYGWFVNSAAYYGLTMSAGDLGSNMYVSVALSGMVELPAYVIAFSLLDRLGRRPTFCFSMLLGGASCMAILLTPAEATMTVTALALLGKLAISSSFAISYIYSAEIYPTVIRNNAMGVCSMAARMGGIVAPMIIPLNSIYPNFQFLVFGGLAFSAGVVSFRLPETLNRAMPETLEDLDTPGRAASLQVAGFPHITEDKVRLLQDDILEKERLREEMI